MPYADKLKQKENLRLWRLRNREGIRETFLPIPCKWCGTIFTPISEKNLFCSEKCSSDHTRKRYGIRLADIGNKCINCGSEQNLTINHKIPQCVRIDNSPSNLEVLCSPCNSKSFQKLIITALRFYFANR